MKELKLGCEFTEEITVSEDMLASHIASGKVDVYATPMMIALMEKTASKGLQEYLEDGMVSVGTSIGSSHVAATPVGMKVKAVARVVGIDGRKYSFEIEAYDECGLIGKGLHERFAVNEEKFNAKAKAKLEKCQK